VGSRLGATVTALGVLAVVCAVCAAHAGEVARAFAAVPVWAAAAAAALHLVTLALRSEAWRLSLRSAGAGGLPRRAVHVANAAAFLAGTLQCQAALPARVALLRRLAGDRAPRPGQIAVADAPIFVVELCATALLLGAGVACGRGDWWIAPLAGAFAVAVLAGLHVTRARCSRRPMVRGLAVLADRRRRGPLVALVLAVVALTVVRVWLVLAVCGLPHGLGEVAWVFAAMGVFGLLPIGPGATPGATLATLGASSLGAALAAGLVLAASSVAAVVAYALLVALERPRGLPRAAAAART
jgi:hypothetical protein